MMRGAFTSTRVLAPATAPVVSLAILLISVVIIGVGLVLPTTSG